MRRMRAATPGKGHGRNGADAYTGAEKIEVPHASLQAGDPCPKCDEGTVYETGRPGVVVRLVGQAPVPPPIQMCDALTRNLPGKLQTILANCLAHGRRQFVDVAERFPEECRHVLESLAVVYRNDAIARERNLSPEERLLFHQARAARRWRNSTSGLYGSSTRGAWSPTRRSAGQFRTC